MECWYCKEKEMELAPELGEGWHKCKGCGATWIDTEGMGEGKPVYAGIPWSKWLRGGKTEAIRKGYIGR